MNNEVNKLIPSEIHKLISREVYKLMSLNFINICIMRYLILVKTYRTNKSDD
jgi:hypothetical protein